MRETNLDSRREVRAYGGGEVWLFPPGIPGYVIGRLLDVSENGFRVAHNYEGIAPGRDVGFKHRFSQGVARVAWTQRLRGHMECGCEIVED